MMWILQAFVNEVLKVNKKQWAKTLKITKWTKNEKSYCNFYDKMILYRKYICSQGEDTTPRMHTEGGNENGTRI